MLEPQDDLQGENPIGIMQLHDEDLLDEIRKWKRSRENVNTTTENIMKALKNVEGRISEDNITGSKRASKKPSFHIEEKQQHMKN